MINGKSYYEILNLDPNCSFDDIKKSFRTLSFKYHPDKNNGEDSIFKEINSAYEILKDKETRNQYDFDLQMKSQSTFPNPYTYKTEINHMNNPISNLFSNIFNDKKNNSVPIHKMNGIFENPFSVDDIITEGIIHGMFNMSNEDSLPFKFNKTNKNLKEENIVDDICIEKEIEFEESFFGCCIPITIERTIVKSYERKELIKKKETEKIYLTIPAGVDDNEIINVEKKGNVYNNKNGNIKVQIKIKPHIEFQRNGLHLVLKKNVSFKESLCGFSFEVNHVNGKPLKFSSSKGNIIQNYDKKIINGLGFERNNKKGNMIIEFMVSHPKHKLNDEQLKLIEENF